MGLDRFITAQEKVYGQALNEIEKGRKQSHWMWFIFPQLKGLGFSESAQYYGIDGIGEAARYLEHPLLGARLIEISNALLNLQGRTASAIFGYPDYLKLRSSITLFMQLNNAPPVFKKVLDIYFSGIPDEVTLKLLK